MKAYIMNKNVEHNGIKYAKGSQIKSSDEGFNDIVNAGHADSISVEAEVEAPVLESEPEQESVESKKSFGKSKK